jgi:hypothetical protein
LKRCAARAEVAKRRHRDTLKAEQRIDEVKAAETGGSLSSAQKERVRSRRESAVTRKRAEIYVRELESVVRSVPALHRRLDELGSRSAGMLAASGTADVKSDEVDANNLGASALSASAALKEVSPANSGKVMSGLLRLGLESSSLPPEAVKFPPEDEE